MVDSVSQVRLVALLRSSGAASTDSFHDALIPPLPLEAGSAVEARVAGRLPNQATLLEVAGQLFQAQLPEDTHAAPGERLRVVVLRAGAEPTLLVERPQDPAKGEASARVDLSSLGSRIAALVSSADKATGTAASAGATVPLLTAPPLDAHGLEAPLRQAVEGSGVFYESHLADWAAGTRPFETIRAEPQARMPVEAGAPPATTAEAESAVDPDAMPRDGTVAGARAGDTTPAPKDAVPPALTPAVAAVVDRQLQALSGQPFVWTGQAWPGQPLEWTIEEQAEDSGGGVERVWASRLKLTLPRLGEVDVRVSLRGDQLAVRVVPRPEHAAEFGEASEGLRGALAARGLVLGALKVEPGRGAG